MVARFVGRPVPVRSLVDMTVDIPSATAERSEAETLYDFEAGTAPADQEALGMSRARIGGGVALSVRNDPSGFWSKALGFTGPVTADLIEEVCAFYRDAGTPRAVIQIAPSLLPDDWAEICAKSGLVGGSSWVKLACPVDRALEHTVETNGLRVEPLSTSDGPEWASVMLRTFGMDEALSPMVLASVGRSGWHPFAAWLGDDIVGTGTLFAQGETGQCVAGATKAEARGRGGQSAILRARAEAAKAAGCRWLIAETGAEQPGEHNSSLHNMLRLGFEVMYERQNWVWSPAE
jgi:GNAT superfamily N-acetyltransferase